ncbi:MAG: ArsR/SmtB family transcription factor [Aliihoeflea sp.]|uniref:ArsR/SmtB family transcription factor n=1 Tax=Aliihoeflea sp. TaxID=2608088 RepID=UPI004034B0C4
MVQSQPAHLDAVFHALSDATRRAMVERLVSGPQSVGDLAAPFDMSLAGASKHIRVLEGAGLVMREVRGRTHRCSLDAARLRDAQDWLARYEKFWNARLDALEALLAADADKGSTDD